MLVIGPDSFLEIAVVCENKAHADHAIASAKGPIREAPEVVVNVGDPSGLAEHEVGLGVQPGHARWIVEEHRRAPFEGGHRARHARGTRIGGDAEEFHPRLRQLLLICPLLGDGTGSRDTE